MCDATGDDKQFWMFLVANCWFDFIDFSRLVLLLLGLFKKIEMLLTDCSLALEQTLEVGHLTFSWRHPAGNDQDEYLEILLGEEMNKNSFLSMSHIRNPWQIGGNHRNSKCVTQSECINLWRSRFGLRMTVGYGPGSVATLSDSLRWTRTEICGPSRTLPALAFSNSFFQLTL